LPEAVVKQLEGVQYTNQLDVDQYSWAEANFHYQRGRLSSFMFGECPLEIGAEREGPFRAFPMSRDDLSEMFGEPEREGRASRSALEWK
jgi:hypothetical protein